MPKRCAVYQQSKINVAFSLTFKRRRRRSNVVRGTDVMQLRNARVTAAVRMLLNKAVSVSYTHLTLPTILRV